MKKETSCGCIIIKDGKVLIEHQKHGSEVFWGFPKGHKEGNETNEQTALREVKEEVGLDVEIIKNLPPVELNYEIKDVKVDKKVFLYFAKLKDPSQQIKIQESEVTEYKWVELAKINEYLTYPLIFPLPEL